MVSTTYSVAFEGLEARSVEVQCTSVLGLPGFSVVGLADKAVSEARERVRAALSSLSLALPSKRVTVNLSPANLPKIGSHFDLALAVALMAELEVIPKDKAEQVVVMGELSLDGRLLPVGGVLPAALKAAQQGKSLLCPASCAAEAAWIESVSVLGAQTLHDVLRHFTGATPLERVRAKASSKPSNPLGLQDIKGQQGIKRGLEIAAAGRHHMLMVGPPGAGKSMLAASLPSLLPPLTPQEALETAVARSIAGQSGETGFSHIAPFRAPHSSTTLPALIGGGRNASPGEIALAHNGVLFMDELPEFSRDVLESLRQPLETGKVAIARANAHVTYDCRFLLVAAANPCKCGYLADPNRSCSSAPRCGGTYMDRISGPLLDRFDIRLDVIPLSREDYEEAPLGESSHIVAQRVAKARALQQRRFADLKISLNSEANGALLDQIASPDAEGKEMLLKAVDRFGLSARGYHRTLKLARTIADLAEEAQVRRPHIAEALSYRLASESIRKKL